VAGGRSSLVELAAERLATGPRHTLDLAREVLKMRGNEGALASALFALLGTDPRFGVDTEGVWALRANSHPGGGRSATVPFSSLRCAVVDVETTGGGPARGDRVIEVAVVQIEGRAIGESFDTLINPGRPIPPWIQGFTGITDRMVAPAPPFEGVAPRVRAWLDDRLFVAHNASFDWGFVSSEFLAVDGAPPEMDRLCTVRLGRLLVPRLGSHGLDALTSHFGIRVDARHRALGDAVATARLLLHLLEVAEERGIHDLGTLQAALAAGSQKRQGPGAPRRRRTGGSGGTGGSGATEGHGDTGVSNERRGSGE